MTDPTDIRRPLSQHLLLILLFLHPLLRACWDLWAQALVYAVLCGIFILIYFEKSPLPARRSSIFAAVALGIYAFAGTLSVLLSAYPHSAYRSLMVDASGLLFFYLGTRVEEGHFPSYIRALVGGAFLAGIWSWWEAYVHYGVPSGPLINANVLAAYLILLLPLALFFVRIQNGAAKAFWFTVTAFLFVTAFGTQSRTAAMVFFLILAVELLEKKPRIRNGVLIGAAALFTAWLVVGGGTQKLFHDTDRLDWWKTSLGMWLNNPLLGVGPGAFGEAYPGYRSALWEQNSLYAHSWLLEMLAERGIIAAGGFLLWLAVLAGKSIGRNSRQIAALRWSIGFFLLYNLIHIGYSFPSVAWIFWFLAGSLWALTDDSAEINSRWPRSILRTGSALALLFVGFFGLRVFRADQYAAKALYSSTEGNKANALELIRLGLKWNHREPDLYALQAQVLAESGREDEADASIVDAIRLSRANADYHALAGELKIKHGLKIEALDSFEKASHLMPLNVLPWFRQAEILESQGRLQESLDRYSNAERAVKIRATMHGLTSTETEMKQMRLLKDAQERIGGKIAASHR